MDTPESPCRLNISDFCDLRHIYRQSVGNGKVFSACAGTPFRTMWQICTNNVCWSTKAFVETRLYMRRAEPDYNDIGLCDTPYIASDILWYQCPRS